jgi:predicted Holliday junction resolvase-like endonuclease
MSNRLATIFGQIGRIVTVCPECDNIFYLSEARPYLKGEQPRSIVDKLRAAARRLEREEERLDLVEAAVRARSQASGRKTAKALLKKIDPVFSGSGVDPQDVKVIFHPVSYIVFDGLAEGSLREVTLLANATEDVATQRVHASIEKAISKGNFEFRTLRVDSAGQVSSE